MVFWGVEVKPGQSVPYDSDEVRGRLHITQATLGAGSSSKKSVLQCVVGENSPIHLCSLLPDKTENCPLNLEYEEEGLVSFSVVGPRSIHLSGFIETDGLESADDEYDSDGIAEMDSDEASSDSSREDDCDDEFTDEDDFEMIPPSPVPKSGVVIEEIVDDEKPTSELNNSKLSKRKKSHLRGKDDNDDSRKQIVVKQSSGVPASESEDEDGFPVSDSINSDSKVQKMDQEAEGRRDVKGSKKKRSREENYTKSDIDLPIRDANQPSDMSLPEAGASEKNDLPNKKKKDSKKLSKAAEVLEVPVKTSDEKMSITKDNDFHPASNGDQSAEKKKKNKKKKSKAEKGEKITAESVESLEKENEVKVSNMREFPNGLIIEDLKMGRPDGKRAAVGKKVKVTYIGKLKKNRSIFDSNVGRRPFEFLLGVGQVIKGWDVGVKGMRVGDKRRLTIPPSMGYGDKGAGPKIPPNSWLMFDVELLDVLN